MTNEHESSLTRERVRDVLAYNPETGRFSWLQSRGCRKAGAEAGTPNQHGYIVIRVDGRLFMAHRLAWLIAHGEWPSQFIDHINKDGLDNTLANLRECSTQENAQNQRRARSSASGRLGVHQAYRPGRWKARIKVSGKEAHLGIFDSVEAASSAYEHAKSNAHPFDRGQHV